METPRSMEVRSPQPMVGRTWRAITQLDGVTRLAMICLLFGWFFTNTLVVSLGSIEHGVRFFDLSAVIGDPTRLFFGIETSVQRIAFGFLCLVCVFTPITPMLSNHRSSWLAAAAPLALMLFCGLLLYSRTSSEFFAMPGDADAMSVHLIHFANDIARRGSNLLSRHVSIGGGAYLALIGALVLAVRGVRRFVGALSRGATPSR